MLRDIKGSLSHCIDNATDFTVHVSNKTIITTAEHLIYA